MIDDEDPKIKYEKMMNTFSKISIIYLLIIYQMKHKLLVVVKQIIMNFLECFFKMLVELDIMVQIILYLKNMKMIVINQ